MCRFLNFRLVAAAIAVACVVGSASPAKAAFAMYLQFDGGPITQVAGNSVGTGSDFGVISYNGTYGTGGTTGTEFAIQALSGSATNVSPQSDLLGSTLRITNTTGSTQTLHIYLSQTNYTQPTGNPLRVESGMSGTNNTGTVNPANVFQAWLDASNTLLGMPGVGNGLQSANVTGTTWDTGSAVGNFARAGMYSLTSEVNLVMSAGAVINFSNHVNVTNATPAPAGLVLVASMLPFVAVLRRRLRKSDAVPVA